MILERVVGIQIEEFFERNNLLGKFQYGFRRNKSTISELINLFDTLMDAKQEKKEVMLVLYDLSAAFDCISHKTLMEKMRLYGFDELSLKWLESYLDNGQQSVTVGGKISKPKKIEIGTPQGSRLSPLLFLCLMADLDCWINKSQIQNFADDTQSIIIAETKEEAIEVATQEANQVISFFASNSMVNNSDKAALLYNSDGKGSTITLENIGGYSLTSKSSEKLLGLNINSEFEWDTHVEKIGMELRKRTGLLKRIKERLPLDKTLMIAESIFNSVIRYGISLYLTPTYEKEDLKARKLHGSTKSLQVLQNNMIRVIMGLKLEDHTNMEKLRTRINMFSVNQLAVYHTLIEAFNVIRKSSAEQVKNKWEHKHGNNYTLRRNENMNQRIPQRGRVDCTGFSYHGAKLFNILPSETRNCENPDRFKDMVKSWIWENIPSY